jgi:hypothetical protein
MLKKILDFEKKALTDKIHMGVSIGLAIEDQGEIKLRFAKLSSAIKGDLNNSFDYKTDRYMINPGIYPQIPVKKIYAEVHKRIIHDMEEDGLDLGTILGPMKAPGQKYKVMNFRSIYAHGVSSETQAQSMLTNAAIYYDDDNENERQYVEDTGPKKLLK